MALQKQRSFQSMQENNRKKSAGGGGAVGGGLAVEDYAVLWICRGGFDEITKTSVMNFPLRRRCYYSNCEGLALF